MSVVLVEDRAAGAGRWSLWHTDLTQISGVQGGHCCGGQGEDTSRESIKAGREQPKGSQSKLAWSVPMAQTCDPGFHKETLRTEAIASLH